MQVKQSKRVRRGRKYRNLDEKNATRHNKKLKIGPNHPHLRKSEGGLRMRAEPYKKLRMNPKSLPLGGGEGAHRMRIEQPRKLRTDLG